MQRSPEMHSGRTKCHDLYYHAGIRLSISYYSDLTPLGVDNEFLSTLYAQTAGSVIGVCILFIPTYFYLKKRFYSPGSVSEVMIKPEKAIPIRLLGVIGQK